MILLFGLLSLTKTTDRAGLVAELQCSSIQSPTNGWKSTGTHFVDTTVQFGCYEGFQSVGSTSLKCLVSQRWNGSAPTCQSTLDVPCFLE